MKIKIFLIDDPLGKTLIFVGSTKYFFTYSFFTPLVIAIIFFTNWEFKNLKLLTRSLTILDSVFRSWCNSKTIFFLNNTNKKQVKKF